MNAIPVFDASQDPQLDIGSTQEAATTASAALTSIAQHDADDATRTANRKRARAVEPVEQKPKIVSKLRAAKQQAKKSRECLSTSNDDSVYDSDESVSSASSAASSVSYEKNQKQHKRSRTKAAPRASLVFASTSKNGCATPSEAHAVTCLPAVSTSAASKKRLETSAAPSSSNKTDGHADEDLEVILTRRVTRDEDIDAEPEDDSDDEDDVSEAPNAEDIAFIADSDDDDADADARSNVSAALDASKDAARVAAEAAEFTRAIQTQTIGGRALRSRETIKKPFNYYESIRADWLRLNADRSVNEWRGKLCEWQQEGKYTPPLGLVLRRQNDPKSIAAEYKRGCSERCEIPREKSKIAQLAVMRVWAASGWKTTLPLPMDGGSEGGGVVASATDVKREYLRACTAQCLNPFTLEPCDAASSHESADTSDNEDAVSVYEGETSDGSSSGSDENEVDYESESDSSSGSGSSSSYMSESDSE